MTNTLTKCLCLIAATCLVVIEANSQDQDLLPTPLQDNASSDSSRTFSDSAEDITSRVDALSQERESSLVDPLQDIFLLWDSAWTWVDKNLGLSMGFAYSTLFQAATPGSYTSSGNGGAGDLDIFGRWNLLSDESDAAVFNESTIGFNLEYRHKIGPITPADLGDSIGSLWGTTSGFDEQEFSVVEWWWEQHFLGNSFAIRAGKLDLANLFDVYGFNSANFFFQNAAFSDNPTIPFPENGLGLAAQWTPTDQLRFRYGFGDAEGRKTRTNVNSLEEIKAWFSTGEISWQGPVGELGIGHYQATFWHSEERSNSEKPSAYGFSLVAEQEVRDGVVPYLRYSWSSAEAVDTQQLLTAGVVFEKPLGREKDRFGLAAGYGTPHNSDEYRDQWTVESFYRLEPFRGIQISPHVQAIFNPSKNRNDDTIGVFGVRARITF